MNVSRRRLLQGSAALAGAMALPRVAMAQDVLKIGQVNASPAAEIGWSKQHALGIEAIKAYAETGVKPAPTEGKDFTDTGVTLITDKPVEGVPSIDSAEGLKLCWG